MAIQESIELVDNASAPLLEAADAAGTFADAVSDAQSAAAGVEADGFEDCADAIEDTTDAAGDAADAIEAVGDTAGEVGQDGAAAFEQIGEAMQGMNAGLEIANKVAKGIAKVAELAAKFGAAVVEAHSLREANEAALDALTGGRGAEALDHLKSLAADLGIETQSAVDQFDALRRAGASNADAEGLIKLRADLAAVGVSAAEQDAAVERAMKAIAAHPDQAADVFAEVAGSFGAVGDGANAAARRALTLTGAIDNAKAAGARMFDTIAEASGPALDAIGEKITSVLDSLEGSGAIEGFAEGFAAALEYVPPTIDAILAAWESLQASAEPGLAALSLASDSLSEALGDAGGGMSAAQAVGSVLGGTISTVANVVAGAVAAVAFFADVLGTLVDAGQTAIDAVSAIPEALSSISLADVGSNLVQSFVDGMASMVGNVIAAAGGIGDAAGQAIKSALGIASPSKVGLAMGENLGESVATGTENAMPPEIEAPRFADIPAAPVANGNNGADGGIAPAASVTIGSLQIIVQAAPGQSEVEIARQVRREFEALARGERRAS